IVSEIDTTTMGTFGDGNGDLQYYNGFLYVCNSNFRTGGIDGKVSKYNADGLSFVQEYSLPVKNVPSTITQKDGYFWVIRYTSPTTLQKYSLDFTQLLGEYTLGNNAGDGVTWIGNYLLINQHEVSDDGGTHTFIILETIVLNWLIPFKNIIYGGRVYISTKLLTHYLL
ncbi:MAG TPA: hypothetical protein VFD03_11710, partial [Clostridia bacterium]|nr:hypothetical protein [Clostridia bacterium]